MRENIHSVKLVNTKKETTFRRVTSMLNLFPDYLLYFDNQYKSLIFYDLVIDMAVRHSNY